MENFKQEIEKKLTNKFEEQKKEYFQQKELEDYQAKVNKVMSDVQVYIYEIIEDCRKQYEDIFDFEEILKKNFRIDWLMIEKQQEIFDEKIAKVAN